MMISECGRLDDSIPEGMCLRCGLTGPHSNVTACIETLRDKIAILEFRLGNSMAVSMKECAAATGDRSAGTRV
jgi:hypothetical protein